ncbi:MAG: hypothetical protein KF859_05270 [Phycisphaeraceae bacterium]|nr:hypothetical protein [Phycisphaeraceae bacterium]
MSVTHKDSGLGIHAAGLTAAIVLSGLAALGILQPAMADRERSASVLQELEKARSRAETLRLERRDLEQMHTQITRALAGQRVVPVPVTQQNQRLAALTELAQRHGLALEQMTPGTAHASPRSTAVAIRMACRGGYPACVAFLRSLHAEYPDTAVVGVRALSPPESAGQLAYIGLDLVWYAAPTAQ